MKLFFGRTVFSYWGYNWTLPVHRTTCSRSWWVAYHLLNNLKFLFSFFILLLHFWVAVLYLVLTFFAVIYFCFIFSNWSSGIGISGKSCTFFLSPVLQWAAVICPSFQVSPSVRKTIFYCNWISECSLGRDNYISTFRHLNFCKFVIICFPVYDVINFEINFVFLIKPFCYMTKKC